MSDMQVMKNVCFNELSEPLQRQQSACSFWATKIKRFQQHYYKPNYYITIIVMMSETMTLSQLNQKAMYVWIKHICLEYVYSRQQRRAKGEN